MQTEAGLLLENLLVSWGEPDLSVGLSVFISDGPLCSAPVFYYVWGI